MKRKYCILLSLGLLFSSCSNTPTTNSIPIIYDLAFTEADASKIKSKLHTTLPCMESADSYTLTEMELSNKSAYCIYLTFNGFDDINEAIENYCKALRDDGYMLDAQYSDDNVLMQVATKYIEQDQLIITVYKEDNSKAIVEAYIYYNVASDIMQGAQWPSAVISELTGDVVVPSYAPKGYKSYYYTSGEDSYGKYVMVALENYPTTATEEYTAILKEAEWITDDTYLSSDQTMIAFDSTNKVKLYYGIDSDMGFTISITLNDSQYVPNPDGGGETSSMTPEYTVPENYTHNNLHGFILDDINEDSSSNIKGHAASLTKDTYAVTDTKKFSFNVQCGEFFGGKYYFFTDDYKFGWTTYSEENGYGQTYIQSSINPIVNSLYNQGYYIIPGDMSFNYKEMKMYVLWIQEGLVDTDEDGYYDSLDDSIHDTYISTFNLNTGEAGPLKDIVNLADGYMSTVVSGIAFATDGTFYGIQHSASRLAKILFSQENDAYYLEPYENTFGFKHPGNKYATFMDYFHGSMAYDHHTGKLYYAWSDWGKWELIDGESHWSGSLGGLMEIDLTTGIATPYFFENAYEITGLFSVYYKPL